MGYATLIDFATGFRQGVPSDRAPIVDMPTEAPRATEVSNTLQIGSLAEARGACGSDGYSTHRGGWGSGPGAALAPAARHHIAAPPGERGTARLGRRGGDAGWSVQTIKIIA